jgi:hypothetical protein
MRAFTILWSGGTAIVGPIVMWFCYPVNRGAGIVPMVTAPPTITTSAQLAALPPTTALRPGLSSWVSWDRCSISESGCWAVEETFCPSARSHGGVLT